MSTAKANLDVAQKLNITARKGDTFRLSVTFKDSANNFIGTTNYSYRIQVRPSAEDNVSDGALLDIGNTNFDTSGTAGTVVINISANDMASIEGGKYVYDLEATSTLDTTLIQTWLKGSFIVNEDVTVNS